MTNVISKYDDVIDSRDVIKRIDELAGDLGYEISRQDPEPDIDLDSPDDIRANMALFEEAGLRDEAEELANLLELQEEAEGYCPDWRHGASIIREDYAEKYAQECAEDVGLLTHQGWPYDCIDWERATKEFLIDYTSVDFAGETFYVR